MKAILADIDNHASEQAQGDDMTILAMAIDAAPGQAQDHDDCPGLRPRSRRRPTTARRPDRGRPGRARRDRRGRRDRRRPGTCDTDEPACHKSRPRPCHKTRTAMAKKGKSGRELIRLVSTADTGFFYTTSKNRKRTPGQARAEEVRPGRSQARRVQRVEDLRIDDVMSRVCQVTGKKPLVGSNVSHSNRHTKRRFEINLRDKRFWLEDEKRWITLRVSRARDAPDRQARAAGGGRAAARPRREALKQGVVALAVLAGCPGPARPRVAAGRRGDDRGRRGGTGAARDRRER